MDIPKYANNILIVAKSITDTYSYLVPRSGERYGNMREDTDFWMLTRSGLSVVMML